MEQEKKGNEVIDLTPDGQKIDYYKTTEKSLLEKRLGKDANTSDRKEQVEPKEPTFWEELKRTLGRIARKLGG